MAKVRIAISAPFLSGRKVGVDVFIENIVAELSREWNLYVYTARPSSFEGLDVRIRPIPAHTRGQPFRLLWENTVFRRQLRRDRIALVLSPFSELPVGLPIPSIAVIHDLTPLILKGVSPWNHTFYFRLALRLLRTATAIVTVSEYTRRDVVRTNWFRGKPVYVIYNGTRFPHDTGRTAANRLGAEPPGGSANLAAPCVPYLLYVGGFAPHKNVPFLLEGFAELKDEIRHRLVLVGMGADRVLNETQNQAARLGLADRVCIFSGISDEQLVQLYEACDIFILPSHYEGFGFPLLEAMACGAPVLSSSASSLPEVGGEAVEYFSPDSKMELVAGIRRLLSDAELRRQMSRKGRARAALFTWSRSADAYSALINELLRRKVGAGQTGPGGPLD